MATITREYVHGILLLNNVFLPRNVAKCGICYRMITTKLRHVRPSVSPSVRQSVAVLPFHPLPFFGAVQSKKRHDV